VSDDPNWFKCTTCRQQRFKGILQGQGPVCDYCKRFKRERWAYHPSHVRCPKCEHVEEAIPDCDYADLYEDGEHEFTCNECNYVYTIETHVKIEFESPPLLEEEGGE